MASAKEFPVRTVAESATILSGATESNAVDLAGCRAVGIVFPAAMTGTGVTISGSMDGTNYYTLHTGSADYAVAKQNSKCVKLDADIMRCARWLKLTSSGAEGADRVFSVIAVPV